MSMKILLAFCFDMKNVNDSSPISDREKNSKRDLSQANLKSMFFIGLHPTKVDRGEEGP